MYVYICMYIYIYIFMEGKRYSSNKKGTSQSLATVFVPKTKKQVIDYLQFWSLLVIKKSAKM